VLPDEILPSRPVSRSSSSNRSPSGRYRSKSFESAWIGIEPKERGREREIRSLRACDLVSRSCHLSACHSSNYPSASERAEFNGFFPRKGKWDELENGAGAKIGAIDRTLPEYFTGRSTAVAKSVVIPGLPL